MHPALMAKKLGYDPTQYEIWPQIASHITSKGPFTCLDICCADGAALLGISDLISEGKEITYAAYGSELDLERYKAAQNSHKFQKVVMGDFRCVRMSYDSVSLQLSNPPYSTEPRKDFSQPANRTEEVSFYKTTNYMAPTGVIIGIWPYSLFSDRGVPVLRHLYTYYEEVRIYQYSNVSKNQVIVMAAKRASLNKDDSIYFSTKEGQRWLSDEKNKILRKEIPEIEMQDEPIYVLPIRKPDRVRFSIDYYDENVASLESDSKNMILGFNKDRVSKENFIAPLLPTASHFALLAAGGYSNGKITDSLGNEHYFAGYSKIEIDTGTEEDEEGREYIVRRNKSSVEFVCLTNEPNSSGERLHKIT